MDLHCTECAKFLQDDQLIESNRKKTRWVLGLTFIAMIAEIGAGYWTRSMAVMADGFHMASHVGALAIALIAYQIARSDKFSRKFSFGAGKMIPLGGYTSAIILGIIAILIFIESIERFFSPGAIAYNEAIGIACFGLIVNFFSALILSHEHGHDDAHDLNHEHEHDEHHHHHVHDHNLRAVFLHIAMDAVTSVLAIGGLILAKYQHWNWIDPSVGIVGALLIVIWAIRLCRDTAWELLDGQSKAIDIQRLKFAIESEGVRIADFHAWRIAPKALACELVIESSKLKGLDHYRKILKDDFSVRHAVIEERSI
jgi:cation diffusion facilitator family transporter